MPLPVATRGGVKTLTWADDRFTVDMGPVEMADEATWVEAHGGHWPARTVSMGNPHAVAFVDDLADVGPLLEPPGHDEAVYPDGVNVEFVVRVAAAARGDAGARARVGGDPLLRHGRLRRHGGQRARRTGPGRGRRTSWTCRAGGSR